MEVFKPYTLGDLTLKNKIVMAPMTRSRAIDNIPNDLMKTYYSQRASAGLIISEGASPSPNGLGYARIPGAYTSAQIKGWEAIAKAVHQKDSVFFVQLMHTGRVSAIQNMPEGSEVWAPSAIHLEGEIHTDAEGMQPHATPKAMTLDDINTVKKEYIHAARQLIKAGVDGVELHSANGYLLDQFLNPKTNIRSDQYGGNYQNRVRLLLEIIEEMSDVISPNKIGVRFSPYGVFNDMQGDYNELVDTYTYLAKALAQLGIAYIHIADQRAAMGAPEFATDIQKTIKELFGGTVIVGGDIHQATQAETLLEQSFDLVYIGRPFIANPNLIEKLEQNKPLVLPNMETLYTPGAEGYTDY